MAKSTRLAGPDEPLQIFQDDMFENSAPMTSHAPMPNVTKPARLPLSSSDSNILNPPCSSNPSCSPFKAKSSSPKLPFTSSQGNKLNAISMAPPPDKAPVTDSLNKKPPLSNFKTGLQKPVADANPALVFDKENIHPQILPAPPTISLSVEQYYQKPNGNRGLMEAAPIIKDSGLVKQPNPDEQTLPPHDSFPPLTDDGTKPPHSYAQLIGMAILRSCNRRLTLSQIYKWISDNYAFYHPNDAGWQNSIRHNLSLHKNFIKIERPKDDPGKGNYWGIEPGTEFQFLKEKPTRKSVPTAENLPVMSTRLEPSGPAPAPTALTSEPILPPPAPIYHFHQPNNFPPLSTSQETLPMPLEPSSDATILVSDSAVADDAVERGPGNNELALGSSFYSPLPAALHSSPPLSRYKRRSGTPPPMNPKPPSSVTRSHKRKFASMDDSGYISSVESSAMRSNPKALLLTSEADRPRIKRGRAEEEIARLRGSSPFSPTKARSFSTYGPISSSPFRQPNERQMLPPLTPVVKAKSIIRPPPSASPNTNLRIHRDKVRHMLQSPLRRVAGIIDDSLPWSPAFHLDETIYNYDNMGTNTLDFDIFQDLPADEDNVFDSIGSVDTGSPIKRSAKRARLDRSVSTPALGELSNSATKRSITTSIPFLKAPSTPSQFLETPSKVFEDLSSPAKLFQQSPTKNASPSKFTPLLNIAGEGDWPPLVIDPTDFASDYTGLDILQGFEKIGSGSQKFKGFNKNNKPTLGRSFSTSF